MIRRTPHVFVAMSGGVDSSVAAGLLLEEGFRVSGVFMKNWSERLAGSCPWEQDEEDVRRVCGQLGISFHVFNFEKEYRRDVLRYFFSEYRAGRTPNPDVICNSKIKFDAFLKRAQGSGADLIATGHYVRRWGKQLLKGVDVNKDQSYFLWQLSEAQRRSSLFPIGSLTKPEVRRLARGWDLATAAKKDSQGICFIGNVDVANWLRHRLRQRPGQIVTTDGAVIGQHDGVSFYTIGQRRGLGIGGGVPYYVVGKDTKKNRLIVGHGNRDQHLYRRDLTASHVHWHRSVKKSFPAIAKIRYRQADQSCVVTVTGQRARVIFPTPQRAITPGQSIVWYQGQTVLGGGVIEKAI